MILDTPAVRRSPRPAIAIAVLGAVSWFAVAADSLRDPAVRDYRDALVLAPWLMFAVTLVCVHLRQRHLTGRAAQLGLVAVLTGTALGFIGNLGVVLGNDAMVLIAFPGAPLFFMIGLGVFGVVTVRANLLPAWAGILIALAQINALLIGAALSWRAPLQPHGNYTGAIGHGAAMLAIAAGLTLVDRGRRSLPRSGQHDVR
jgi:hypothetical protein